MSSLRVDTVHPVIGRDLINQYCRLQKRGVRHHEVSQNAIERPCTLRLFAAEFRFPGVAQHFVMVYITPDLAGWRRIVTTLGEYASITYVQSGWKMLILLLILGKSKLARGRERDSA